MASAADSEAFFREHAAKIGVNEAVVNSFVASGVTTISQAAYAASPLRTCCANLGRPT